MKKSSWHISGGVMIDLRYAIFYATYPQSIEECFMELGIEKFLFFNP